MVGIPPTSSRLNLIPALIAQEEDPCAGEVKQGICSLERPIGLWWFNVV